MRTLAALTIAVTLWFNPAAATAHIACPAGTMLTGTACTAPQTQFIVCPAGTVLNHRDRCVRVKHWRVWRYA